MEGGIFCPFCEDHHYHTHRASDGKPIIKQSLFGQHDTFRLAKPIGGEPIPVGSHGVVLCVFGGNPCQYEVEFPDGHGGNLGRSMTYTITQDQMILDK